MEPGLADWLALRKKDSPIYRHCDFNSTSHDTSILEFGSKTLSLSLLCPISLQRQIVPGRTLGCQHPQTFDLIAYLDSLLAADPQCRTEILYANNSCFFVRKCPICKLSGFSKSDPCVKELLDLFADSNEVIIDQFGDATPKLHPALEDSIIDLVTPTVVSSSVFTFPPIGSVGNRVLSIAPQSSVMVTRDRPLPIAHTSLTRVTRDRPTTMPIAPTSPTRASRDQARHQAILNPMRFARDQDTLVNRIQALINKYPPVSLSETPRDRPLTNAPAAPYNRRVLPPAISTSRIPQNRATGDGPLPIPPVTQTEASIAHIAPHGRRVLPPATSTSRIPQARATGDGPLPIPTYTQTEATIAPIAPHGRRVLPPATSTNRILQTRAAGDGLLPIPPVTQTEATIAPVAPYNRRVLPPAISTSRILQARATGDGPLPIPPVTQTEATIAPIAPNNRRVVPTATSTNLIHQTGVNGERSLLFSRDLSNATKRGRPIPVFRRRFSTIDISSPC